MMPISNDSLGQLLRRTIEASNVVCCAKPSDSPTALAVVSLNDGQPSYQFYRNDTADRQVSQESMEANLPETVTACHVGGAAIASGADGEAVTKFIAEQSKKGVTVTYDPNIRPAFFDDPDAYRKRFEATLKAADLMKLSDEDMEWLYPGVDIHEKARDLFATEDLGLLILTKGADGAVAICTGGEFEVPAAPVPNLVDTVGAGDTFMATIVAELTKHDLIAKEALRKASRDQIADILKTAAKAAAINCGRKGCNPPTTSELHSG